MFMQVSPRAMVPTTTFSRWTVALTLQSTAPRYRRSPKTNSIPSLAVSPDLCIKLIGSLALQNLLEKLGELERTLDTEGLQADVLVATAGELALYQGLVLESCEVLFTPAEA